MRPILIIIPTKVLHLSGRDMAASTYLYLASNTKVFKLYLLAGKVGFALVQCVVNNTISFLCNCYRDTALQGRREVG